MEGPQPEPQTITPFVFFVEYLINMTTNAAVVSLWCSKLAFAFIALSLGAGFIFLFRRTEALFKSGLCLLGCALTLQAAAFAAFTISFWAVPEHRFYLPLHTFKGMILFLSLAVNAILFGLEFKRGTGVTFVFVLPWSLLALLGPAFAPTTPFALLDPKFKSVLFLLHPPLLLASYALLINAFGASSSLLLSNWELRTHKPHQLTYSLPSIDEMDRLIWLLVSAAVPLLITGMFLGGVQLHYARLENARGLDIKELVGLATIMVYGSSLVLRKYGDWRGTKAAWANVAGFILIITAILVADKLSAYHKFFF